MGMHHINPAAAIVAEIASREPDYGKERKLPEGMTCAECQHGRRCDGLFGAIRKGFTACDFWPSRFRSKTESDQPDKGEA